MTSSSETSTTAAALDRLIAYRSKMFDIAKKRASLVVDTLLEQTAEAMKHPEIIELNAIIAALENQTAGVDAVELVQQLESRLKEWKAIESEPSDPKRATLLRIYLKPTEITYDIAEAQANAVVQELESIIASLKPSPTMTETEEGAQL